ncbi:metal-dependent hydrolase [Haloarchaeobius sp. HRN-SO-5]|uniref:metal-dependent hydrolase n=1 Tax=Haloarchaeobius sp. HRN-SO-5 TaxID=3446118 RepID=UPI003EBB508F
MPSTVVHVALAGIVACALLGPAFSGRALLVVLAFTVLVDLDVFLGFVWLGAHRAAFHSLLFPALLGAVVYYDRAGSGPSRLRERFGGHAHRVGYVVVAALVFGAIGPDLTTNGVNVFWPLHDQFYAFSGEIHISDQQGLVQTFVDFSNGEPAESVSRGSTQETQYRTGVDTNPDRSGEPEVQERVFPVVDTGVQLLLVVTSVFLMASRLWEERTTQAQRE